MISQWTRGENIYKALVTEWINAQSELISLSIQERSVSSIQISPKSN